MHIVMPKQRLCPSNTGCWFCQFLAICHCLDGGGGVTPVPLSRAREVMWLSGRAPHTWTRGTQFGPWRHWVLNARADLGAAGHPRFESHSPPSSRFAGPGEHPGSDPLCHPPPLPHPPMKHRSPSPQGTAAAKAVGTSAAQAMRVATAVETAMPGKEGHRAPQQRRLPGSGSARAPSARRTHPLAPLSAQLDPPEQCAPEGPRGSHNGGPVGAACALCALCALYVVEPVTVISSSFPRSTD